MTPISRAIGHRIRTLRTARGMTQGQLAILARSRRPIICRLERGMHDPELPTLARLADAMRVPLWAIAGAIDDVPAAERSGGGQV